MANKDDYLTDYRKFFENFAQTVNPNEQLPVKLGSYKFINLEVVGGIIDWTTQYLNDKKCPKHLLSPLIKIIIEEMRKACKKQPLECGYNPSEEIYEPLKLMQSVIMKTNEVCLRYLENSTLCTLPSPGPPYYITTACAVRNSRRRMEDRHVIIHDLNTIFNQTEASPSSYYAVFDGHAGHDAAAYSAAHLHQYLAESKHFVYNPEQALIDAFCKTDALFVEKCKVEGFGGGTTAVCALLRPKEKSLYIAWVGDSQALLANHGRILQCVNSHKPSREDEKYRIQNQGGVVLFFLGIWRVNGQLAVSRAIGDAECKPYVIAVPEVREIPLSGTEDFLIIACDGLWDFLSEEDAASAVYSMVCDNPEDTDRISQRLVQLSKEQGSDDNISVIVVFLREPSKIASESRWAASTRSGAVTMDAGLDNAATNNPFTHSDGEMLAQMDGFLQKIVEGGGYKTNGADPFYVERTNGKRRAGEFEDEDMGPETDVDALDEVTEKMDVDQKHETELMDKAPREETPTPTVDEVLEAGLVDNVAESGEDSEDEWNFYRPEKENTQRTSQPDQEVAAITGSVEDVEEEEEEEDGSMSQLNPDAAEFVPISPTRTVDSPAWRALKEESVISQSPRRVPNEAISADINLPNEKDFELEVKNRPSECFSNGHDNGHKISSLELMENLLNGKNIEDIEFQPNSTPVKPSEDFHFGPNATPFSTPSRILDQSETLSTKANFGDESTASYLDGKGFDSSFDKDVSSLHFKKEIDPMSMSFYAEKDEGNPFDLNKVQVLPDNLDEFLSKPDEDTTDQGSFNETISDLPEHEPICKRETDLLGVCELPKSPTKTPEPTMNENLCESPYEVSSNSPQLIKPDDICEIKGEAGDVCALSPEHQKDTPEEHHDLIKSASPEILAKTPEATSVDLVSVGSPEPLEEISAKSPELCEVVDVHQDAKSPDSVLEDEGIQSPELVDESVTETPELLVCSKPPQVELAKSPEPEIAMSPEPIICEKNTNELQESICNKSPEPQIFDDLVCRKYSEEIKSEKDTVSESPEPSQAKSPQLNNDFEKQDVENVMDLKSNIPLDPAEAICTKSSEFLEESVEDEMKKSLIMDSMSPEPLLENCKSPKPEEIPIDISSPVENVPKSPDNLEEFEKSTETMQFSHKSPEPMDSLTKSPEPLVEMGKLSEPYEKDSKSPEPMEVNPKSTESVEILVKSPEPIEEVTKSPMLTEELEELVESQKVEEMAKSPEPTYETTKSPEPIEVVSPEPVEELGKSSEPLEEIATEYTAETSKSPEPTGEMAKSPEPTGELSKSPEPTREMAKSPEPTEEMAKSPEPTEEIAKSPELIEDIAKSPEPIDQCTKSIEVECVFQPAIEARTPEPSIVESSIPVDNLNAKSPEPVMETVEAVLDVVSKSPEPISDEIVKHTEPVADDMICTRNVTEINEVMKEYPLDEVKSPLEEQKSLSEDIHSLIEDDVKLEEPVSDKLSPVEDITSSVKDDDIVSPVENLNYAQQLSSAVQENISSEISSPLENKEIDTTEEIQVDKELLLELHSVEPRMCVYPLKTRQVNENEEVVKSPTEVASQEVDTNDVLVIEAKPDIAGTPEVIVTPITETSAEVKPIVDEDLSKQSSIVPEVAATAAVAAVGAAVAVVALKEEKKSASKSKTTPTTKKPATKPLAAKSPSKPTPPATAKTTPRTPPSKAATSPTTPKTATPSSARTPLSRTLAPRTPKASPAPPTAKPSPKPRATPSATAKAADKKPLMNGDVKKSAVPPIKKPTTAAAALTKTAAPKPTSAAKPAAAKSTTAARAVPSAAKPTSARPTTTTAAKPRPTSLTTKTTNTTAKSTLGTKPATSPSASKAVSATKSKPASTTTSLKPRVPLTKPAAKAPDTEKQNKENVNKLTASRNSTSATKTTSGTAKTTSVRKTEIKGVANSRTTTTKTTTTTVKGSSTLAAKKPIGDTKTKVTKVSKPKENGVTTVTEITTTTTTMNEMDPQLLKDLSPIENMIIDNSQLADNAIAD